VILLTLLGAATMRRFGTAVFVLATFAFCFVTPTFGALWARAFPAGERLVAGFRRVDFPAKTRLRDDDDADVFRGAEREASFFTLLAIGLLMRKALVLKDEAPQKSPRNSTELSTASRVIQPKNRVCGCKQAQCSTMIRQDWPGKTLEARRSAVLM
jgi:hypothetical protein